MRKEDMIKWEERLLLLLAFEQDLDSVTVLNHDGLEHGGHFFNCLLHYVDEDGERTQMAVPVVYYDGNDWAFTPCDWQGWLPSSAAEMERVTWRVNGTETEAVMFNGQPMLAPWVGEIEDATQKRRQRRIALGRRLREAREKAGFSIREVEERTGISKSIISRTEGGRANTTIDTIAALAGCYGMRLELTD